MGMAKTLFEYRDYRRYLQDRVDERPRGERSRLAQHLRCHLTYVSQVLGGTAHLSPEQSQLLNRYYDHSEEEGDFFLNLVLHARAGTRELAAYYLQKIEKTIEQRLILKNRLQYKKTLTLVDQATYYSAWHYTAVHFALTIPLLQKRETIARYLGLSISRVGEALDFLVSVGIAHEENGLYQTGTTSIHLGNDSPMLPKHHANWKVQGLRSLDLPEGDDFHYTSVVTLSKKDLVKIKSLLVSAIEQIRPVIRESPKKSFIVTPWTYSRWARRVILVPRIHRIHELRDVEVAERDLRNAHRAVRLRIADEAATILHQLFQVLVGGAQLAGELVADRDRRTGGERVHRASAPHCSTMCAAS